MEPLFSSPQHMFWFILSMFMLINAAVVWKTMRNPMFFIGLMIFHAFTAVSAVIYVALNGNGSVYSVHCIWFNSLMAAVYYLLWRHAKKVNAS